MPTVLMPTIAEAYRAGQLPEFFRLDPTDLSTALTETRSLDRAALAAALRAYHHDLGTLDGRVEAQLERLAHPASRVVVSGQQAGLLTGPAYSIHKAADAVLLARDLDRDDAPVVPVFWVASQDHDAAEVASATLLDLNEELHHLTLDLPQGVPVGRIAWQDAWTEQVLDVLQRFEAPPEHRARVVELVRAAAHGSYADVFARLVHGLLGAHGLLILDPMHPALAALQAPTLRAELQRPLDGPQRIEEAARALDARGFEPQLRRPAGATNVFLEGPDGQRRLLRWDGKVFHAEREYGLQELLDLLDAEPSRLTPAAGLRPVVQDAMLPTVAFVVGPGEIAYAAQLAGVYELHGLRQTLLWPRLSVTWLEPPVARILGRFGLSAREFQRRPDEALGAAVARERGASAVSEERLDALRQEFQRLAADIADLDPTLVGAVRRTEARTTARIERLQAQARRALTSALDVKEGQAGRLRVHLLPRGVPQEREMSFLTYLLKHGDVPLNRLLTLRPGSASEERL